jgi:hypothetical protein
LLRDRGLALAIRCKLADPVRIDDRLAALVDTARLRCRDALDGTV